MYLYSVYTTACTRLFYAHKPIRLQIYMHTETLRYIVLHQTAKLTFIASSLVHKFNPIQKSCQTQEHELHNPYLITCAN